MAVLQHTQGSTLTLHEYPTTGGLTLQLPGCVLVNAPFDEPYCQEAEVWLEEDGAERLVLRLGSDFVPILRVLPLPGYLQAMDNEGRPVRDVVMSHADRVRISPITGCVYDCGFCDFPQMKFELRPLERLLAALRIAQSDTVLPTRHMLISGGSPGRKQYPAFEEIIHGLIAASPGPVDLMMSPMVDNLDFLDRMVASGLAGLSINLEVFTPKAGQAVMPGKYRSTRSHFAASVTRAVHLLGASGRVRSLIIPGLESMENTLKGVEDLAALGCHPTLSPFRPASGTSLTSLQPPSVGDLTRLLDMSRSIVARNHVNLGPDCAPCQHNTLAFPWDLE